MIEADRKEQFSYDGWKKCAAFGIQGLPVPEQYGGSGADILTTVCGLEALGYGCRDNGLIFSINAHMWSAEIPFLSFGTDEQKDRYLPKLVSGEMVGVHAMTEPMSGSDAYSLRTRAEKVGDCYVINGSKTFISNAIDADVTIVFANVDPSKGAAGITAFVVDKGTPGLKVSRKLEKMGLRTSQTAELALEDCRVPASCILGKLGMGADLHCGAPARVDAARARNHHQVCRIETAVRRDDREIFGGRGPNRGDGHAPRMLPAGAIQSRVAEEARQTSAAGSRHCQTVRSRIVRSELHGRDQGSRRLRVHDRISTGARDARRGWSDDLFGHFRHTKEDHCRLPRPVVVGHGDNGVFIKSIIDPQRGALSG